jgi:hypothetical protein
MAVWSRRDMQHACMHACDLSWIPDSAHGRTCRAHACSQCLKLVLCTNDGSTCHEAPYTVLWNKRQMWWKNCPIAAEKSVFVEALVGCVATWQPDLDMRACANATVLAQILQQATQKEAQWCEGLCSEKRLFRYIHLSNVGHRIYRSVASFCQIFCRIVLESITTLWDEKVSRLSEMRKYHDSLRWESITTLWDEKVSRLSEIRFCSGVGSVRQLLILCACRCGQQGIPLICNARCWVVAKW